MGNTFFALLSDSPIVPNHQTRNMIPFGFVIFLLSHTHSLKIKSPGFYTNYSIFHVVLYSHLSQCFYSRQFKLMLPYISIIPRVLLFFLTINIPFYIVAWHAFLCYKEYRLMTSLYNRVFFVLLSKKKYQSWRL